MYPLRGSFAPHCHYHVTTKEYAKAYQNSLALHTQQNPKDILINRKSLTLSLAPLEFVVAHQIHSDRVEVVNRSIGWHEESALECDGLITNQKNLVLTILTADCVPILLHDPIGEVIGAVHAGWRGTKAHIVAKTIEAMQREFGTNPKDTLAYIAPSIGKCCYEVGEDVAKYFEEDSYTQKGDKFRLDLPYLNAQQLLAMGVAQENITHSHICTACEVERFFSYRQECGCEGRFMSMVWMES